MNCRDAFLFESEKSQSRKVARLKAQSSKLKVQSSRFKVQSSKFKAQGSRFKAQKNSILCCLLSVDFLLSLQFTYLHYI